MTDPDHRVTVGVDTHLDTHVAAAFNHLGQPLGHLEIPTTPVGYRRLLGWAQSWGSAVTFGIEGTGSFGAGLARSLRAAGCTVIEVSRPNRRTRRSRGKSDPLDAVAAARAVIAGEAASHAKADDDRVGMLRSLRIARRSAVKMRTQIGNQMKALVLTAPTVLRERLRHLNTNDLVAIAAGLRPGPITTPAAATKLALRGLAERHRLLTAELDQLDVELRRLTVEAAPDLLAILGVGPEVAGALLLASGDNPHRLRSEAAFANLCGVAPLPASSGKTHRHRLNRGGDRHANNALWRIVMVRLAHDPRTRQYVERRTAEGLSRRDIVRCLKRYVAREVFLALRTRALTPAAT
jgi:transposase